MYLIPLVLLLFIVLYTIIIIFNRINSTTMTSSQNQANTAETSTVATITEPTNRPSYNKYKKLILMHTPVGRVSNSSAMHGHTSYLVSDEHLEKLKNGDIQGIFRSDFTKDINLARLISKVALVKFSMLENDPLQMLSSYRDSTVDVNYKGFHNNDTQYSRELIDTYFDLVKTGVEHQFDGARFPTAGIFKVKDEYIKNIVSFRVLLTENKYHQGSAYIQTTEELVTKFNNAKADDLETKATAILEAFELHSSTKEANLALLDLQIPFVKYNGVHTLVALDSGITLENKLAVETLVMEEPGLRNVSKLIGINESGTNPYYNDKATDFGFLDLRLFK